MRVFVTGASGWIGSAVVPELIAAGHDVVGLVRTDEGAAKVAATGATALRGDLDDLDGLRAGAVDSDGVIHLGFKHDFADMAGAGRTERAAIQAMARELEGSDRPFLFASGVAGLAPGGVVTEKTVNPAVGAEAPRGGAEAFAFEFVERGVRSVALRFAPTVHGDGDHGFIATIAGIARDTGVSAYIADGGNRWPAVNRADLATMIVLALDKAPAGSALLGVAENGIATRDIAAAIGRELELPVQSVSPEDAPGHFGWMAAFFGMDCSADSAGTQQLLGWTPTHRGLLADLEAGFYTR